MKKAWIISLIVIALVLILVVAVSAYQKSSKPAIGDNSPDPALQKIISDLIFNSDYNVNFPYVIGQMGGIDGLKQYIYKDALHWYTPKTNAPYTAYSYPGIEGFDHTKSGGTGGIDFNGIIKNFVSIIPFL